MFFSVFKHVLNPLQKGSIGSPLSIVTALVDQIDFTGILRPDCDIRMSGVLVPGWCWVWQLLSSCVIGHVTWVGTSSAESTLCFEQLVDGEWVKFTDALFVLVARDPLNRGAAFINPLELVTEEEKELFKNGEANKKRYKMILYKGHHIIYVFHLCSRRYQISQDSLFKVPPTLAEQDIIHDFFIKTVDHKAMSFKARIKPQNSVWFEDAKLKNLIICQPENRNRFNKIFGGFIMRQAFELAWANAYVFGKSRPFCMNMDDILFKAPVEVGELLYFNSQICYTEDNYIQTRVSAEVWWRGMSIKVNVECMFTRL